MNLAPCLPIAGLALIATACAQPPPQPNLAADAATIRQLTAEWFAAENRKDMAATLKAAAQDIVVQPADGPEIRGLPALQQWYEGFYKLPIDTVLGGSLDLAVAASGDLAYDVGWNKVVLKDPSQGTVADSGKYLFVWRKTAGEWKAVAGSFSSNAPRR